MASLNYTAIQLALRAKLATLSAATTTPFARASTATYINASGTMATAAVNVLRAAHYVGGVLQSPLYETASSNVALSSEVLGGSGYVTPASTGVTVTANTTVAPDGTTTADTVARIAGAGDKRLQQNIAIPNDSTSWCFSLRVRKTSGDPITSGLVILTTGGSSDQTTHVRINTDSGVVVQLTGQGTGGVVNLSPTYWLVWCSVANNSTGATTLASFYYPDDDGTSGAGSKVAWGWQIENTAAPTSYMGPTTVAPVSRAADVDILLSATATGYARQTGSFITDGITVGQEITPVGFATNVPDTVEAATALTVTTLNSKTVEAAQAGRSLSVLNFSFAGENLKFTPVTGRPYIEEQLVPGPTDLSSFGALGNITAEPIYVLNVYTPSNEGFLGGSRYVDSLMALFCPSTTMTLSTGDSLFVRADIGPYRGQVQQVDGWSCISVKIPLRVYTANSI